MLKNLHKCWRIWFIIQLLQKLATAATHTLLVCLLSKNIHILKDAVRLLVPVLTLPCFCHNKSMQHGLPNMPCSTPLHPMLDNGSLCLENAHFKFKIHVFCSFPQPLYANVGIIPWLGLGHFLPSLFQFIISHCNTQSYTARITDSNVQ